MEHAQLPIILVLLSARIVCCSPESGAHISTEGDTLELVQLKISESEGAEPGADEDDPPRDEHDETVRASEIKQLVEELRGARTSLKRTSDASSASGAPPGWPQGGAVGSLEPLVGPLADQTWRISRWARTVRRDGPNPLTSVNDMISEVMGEIGGFVKEAFLDLEARIDALVTRARSLGSSVVKLKSVSDASEETLYNCRKQEMSVLGTAADLKQALTALRDEKDRVCTLRDNARYFNWTIRHEGNDNGVCNFNELGGQKCAFSAIAENANNLSKEYTWARQNFFSLKDECEKAMDALDKQLAQEELSAVPSKNFNDRKADCEAQETKTYLAMCAFGDRLQEKCNGIDELKELLLKLTSRDGSLQSLHYAAQDLKCNLLQLKASQERHTITGGAEMPTKESLGSPDETVCEVTTFEAFTGGVKTRSNEIELLTSGKYFACEDATMSFFGKRILNAGQTGQYFEIDFAPSVTVRPMGTYSFDFCRPAYSLTTTTITATSTTETTTTGPNTTTTTLLPGFP